MSLQCESVPLRKDAIPGNKKTEVLKSAKALVGILSLTLVDFVYCGNHH